ncbi:glucosaminidase domain-containing protein [Burkholderia glumae]|uniref:glucosaminidase domain-containing protein n=1 Tax=Burkholderia glumae TaxID=337 RepID=UPI00214F8B52|nr:glucosaminidase domain-containing protein [Burkholderia glumae]
MATIVDALVVTLGLDAAAFKRGKAEASQATKKLTAEELAAAKKIEANNKIAAESFKRVRTEVLALVGLFTAGLGLTAFTVNTIKTAAALDRMSNNLGMSARDLASWQLAARNAGSSAEGITAALAESQNAVAGLKYGQIGESMQWFLRLGGNMSDLKDGNTYLLARSRIIANMFKVDPGRARFIAQQMGISDDAFNLLKQGPEVVQRYRDQQAALADEMARAAAPAEALRKQFDLLETKLQSVAVAVLTDLMPMFERLLRQLDSMATWVSDHKEDINQWVDNAVKAVGRFIEWADRAADSVGGWKNVLAGLLALKILSIVAPLLQLGAALAGVGAGLGLIGRVGVAGVAVMAALWAAKKLGLPDVDAQKGIDDVRRGDFLAASTHLPAMDLIRAFAARMGGKSNEDIAKDLESSLGASKSGDEGFAQQIAALLSGTANAAEPSENGIPADLARKAGPAAVAAALRTQQLYGVPAAVTLAQYGLESGFGSKMPPGSNNPFGIHARAGQASVMGYDWDASGNRVPTKFAKYASIDEAFEAHGKLLATGSAYAAARRNQGDPLAYAMALTGTYATDPQYGQKLAAMMGMGGANAYQIAQQTAAVARSGGRESGSTSMSTSETNIGSINVNSQATDAAGIARDIGSALKRYNFTVAQANTGSF